jgi:gliding motility-associated-like protein
MKKLLQFFLIIIPLLYSLTSSAQVPTNQDCLGAIPVCQNTYWQAGSYTGTGNYPNEINSGGNTCLLSGEKNDVWYIFTAITSGQLAFAIQPNNSADDYDWAVYNLTNANCSNIYSNSALEVCCNYSGSDGTTGMNPASNAPCNASASDNLISPTVWVNAGETYVLNVSNYSSTQDGYNLNFGNSTASIFDNVPPDFQSVNLAALTCGTNQLSFNFSENVLCNTVDPCDFQLTGPGGPYTVTAVTGAQCVTGAPMENTFTLTFSPAMTQPGNYNIALVTGCGSVTDNCGNTAPANNFDFVNTAPGVSITPTSTSVCPGACTDLVASGATSYTWMPGSLSGATINVCPASSTTYTVTGNSVGCTSTAIATVDISAFPTVTATATPSVICTGTCSSITASGATTYSWMPGGLSGATVSVCPTITTIYTVTGTTAGCTGSAEVTVTVGPSITVTAVASPASICFGDSTTLTASGGATYSWSHGLGTSNPVNAGPAATTIYTVTGDSSGCSGLATVSVTVNPTPIISITPASPTICQGQSVNLVASGASSYVWHHGNTLSDSAIANPDANPMTTTTYTVNGTSAQNCSGVGNVTVTVFPAPQATISGGGTICNDGTSTATVTITLTGASPWTVTYTNGTTPTTVNITTSPYTFTTSVGGTYTVTSVLDGNSCNGFGVGSALVNVVSLPVVVLPQFANACISSPAFPLTGGTPTGGTYSGPGVSSNNFNPATAGIGTHTITYTYTSGTTCTGSATNTITVEALPTVTLQAFTPVCVNAGPFTLNGGSPAGGTYSGPGIAGNIFTASTAGVGTHTITYTYTNTLTNCTNSTTGQIVVNALPVVSLTQLPSPCLNDIAFTLTQGSPVGGVYAGPGVVGDLFTPVSAGAGIHTITYTYTDPLTTCSNSATQNITVKPLPNMTLQPFGDVCISTPTFGLTGGYPLGGIYSGPSVTNGYFDPSLAGAGTHTITYTYTDPITTCSNFISGQLVVKSGIPITVVPGSANVCKGFPVTLQAYGADTYHWTPPSWLNVNNDSIVISSPEMTTTYTVNGSVSTNSCSGSTTVTVSVYPPIGLQFDAQPVVGCRPLHVTYNILPNPQIDSNSIVWNFGNVLSDTNTAINTFSTQHTYYMEGNYYTTLTVNSINGCPETVSRLINVYVRPEASFTHVPEIAGIENPTVYFYDNTIGATSWLWDFDDPNTMIDNYSNLQNPIHTFSDSGSYDVVLVASAHNGCEDTAVHVVLVQPGLLIFIPNAFTPNGDKLNETFKPSTLGVDPKTYTMNIFDRWGKKVFETSDLELGWDGKGKDGKMSMVGVYVYKIWFTDMNGKEYKRSGIVTLVR